jgi:hypothetical protein
MVQSGVRGVQKDIGKSAKGLPDYVEQQLHGLVFRPSSEPLTRHRLGSPTATAVHKEDYMERFFRNPQTIRQKRQGPLGA